MAKEEMQESPPPTAASPPPIARAAKRRIVQAAGSAVAIAAMIAIARWAKMALPLVPFATSIVLVMGTPEAEPAQPRALVGGHIVSTLAGFAALALLGPGPAAAALGVGLATIAMHATRTFHPPAGIDPLIIGVDDVSFSFLVAPVASGAVSLAAFAFVWHRVWGSGPWPRPRCRPAGGLDGGAEGNGPAAASR